MTSGFGLKMDFDNFKESHIKGRVELRRKVVMREQSRGVGEIVWENRKKTLFKLAYFYYSEMMEFKHI